MKKTIIAAAVAASVAAPAAFADVKISGMVAPEYTFVDGDAKDEVKKGGDNGAVYTDLVISGSEDLGNGLTASFKYHTYYDQLSSVNDDDDDNGSEANASEAAADMSVAISGDFGTIKAGRFESFAEGVMDAFANIEGINAVDLEAGDSALAPRANSSIAYVSPAMNGLSIGVSTTEVDGDMNVAHEIMVKYSNNGLTVMASKSDIDNDEDHRAVAVSYKIGDLELRATKSERTVENDTTNVLEESDYKMIGAKYTMGSNVISAGMADDEGTDKWLVALTHNLSKNTSVYAGLYNSDNGDTDVDTTVVGISQKF